MVGVEPEVDGEGDSSEGNEHAQGTRGGMPDDDWADARSEQEAPGERKKNEPVDRAEEHEAECRSGVRHAGEYILHRVRTGEAFAGAGDQQGQQNDPASGPEVATVDADKEDRQGQVAAVAMLADLSEDLALGLDERGDRRDADEARDDLFEVSRRSDEQDGRAGRSASDRRSGEAAYPRPLSYELWTTPKDRPRGREGQGHGVRHVGRQRPQPSSQEGRVAHDRRQSGDAAGEARADPGDDEQKGHSARHCHSIVEA